MGWFHKKTLRDRLVENAAKYPPITSYPSAAEAAKERYISSQQEQQGKEQAERAAKGAH